MELTMPTVPVSLRVKPDIRERLEIIAKNDNRSLSQVISLVLENFLNEEEEKRKAFDFAITEAIEEADKGVFVSKELMHKWFDSLGTDTPLEKPKADIFLNKK